MGDVVKIEKMKVTPENESLVPVDVSHPVILSAPVGSTKIRVWADQQKTVRVTLPAVYVSRASVPNELWVEGFLPSDSIRDATIRLWWNGYTDEIKLTVPEVDKIVLEGTSNEGALHVWDESDVRLEAKPRPAGALFPMGEPHWEVYSQPTGADATITPDANPATATLSDLTVPGNYSILARSGPVGMADTILVIVHGRNIEVDVKDRPPTGKTYASGVNPDSIVLKLNGIEVEHSPTPITDGYRVFYRPTLAQLNPPYGNNVELKVRDKANAGRDEGQPASEGGNPPIIDPYTWSY